MLHELVAVVAKSGRISASDVLSFRKAVYQDGQINESEADAIFSANDAAREADLTWGTFFVEAICDYVVHQMDPHGYVSAENAHWLLARINSDGQIESTRELELLVTILEQAKSVPDTLATYALQQVKHAVLHGSGPLRSGKQLQPGVVVEADVELLRRILYAYAGGGNISVTTAEAEVLFDINDATSSAANHPSWPDLFAKAIANHLMFASNHQTVSREVALRREDWMKDTNVSIGGFMSSMVNSLREIYKVANFQETDDQKARREAYFGKPETAEVISSGESRWLVERINRDGKMSEAEKAALMFIKQEATDIHPDLMPLLDRVA